MKESKKIEEESTEKAPEVKITFRRIVMYFIIYSIGGFIVESIFAMLTKGVIESRKSFLYGPFCGIYGLGAAIMIPGLQKFKKNNVWLAIGGFIEGSIIEYAISWIGELIFQVKWWDYSDLPLNINGRVCLIFSIFWALLAVALIRLVNPHVEKIIDKMPKKWFNIISIVGGLLLFADFLFSSFGLSIFYTRLVNDYNLDLAGQENLAISQELQDNETVKWLSDNVFTNEKMIRTFPNIVFKQRDGKIVFIRDVLPGIQPYYYKISDKIHL